MTDHEAPLQLSAPVAGPSRRTMVAGALWAVPAISIMAQSPAYAASNTRYRLAVSPVASVLAQGPTALAATVSSVGGSGAAGQPVTLSLGTKSATGTTDGSGVYATQVDMARPWAVPGSTAVIGALSNSLYESTTAPVVGANVLVASSNYAGQLGTGSSGSDLPTLQQTSLVFPSPVVQISASGTFAMARLADGSVWTTGWNHKGQLGDGTTTNRSVWARVAGVSGVISIATTLEACLALTSTGEVWGWGAGTNAQLGHVDASKWGALYPTPFKIVTLAGATSLASTAPRAVFVVMGDGTVRTWGAGSGFQRGDGVWDASGSLSTVTGLNDVIQVASGFGAGGIALKSDGTVWSWGDNSRGQQCDGTTNARPTPARITQLSDIVQISAGPGSTIAAGSGYALKSDGTVWAWGENGVGQLGDGTTADRNVPVQVPGLAGVTQIEGSITSAFALLSDGRLAAWGETFLDGVGTTSSPRPLTPPRPVSHVHASQHNTNGFHGLFLLTGTTTLTVDVTAQTVTAGQPSEVVAKVAGGSLGVSGVGVSVAATRGAVVTDPAGSTDANGEYRTTVTPDAWTTPGATVRVSASDDSSQASDDVQVLGANLLVASSNYFGILGVGTKRTDEPTVQQTSRMFPSPVVDVSSSGAWAIARLQDGTVWTTGGNFTGALGDGTTTDRYVWGIVPGLSDVVDVTTTLEGCLAVTRSGDVWAWGKGLEGQLGQADPAQWNAIQPTPTKVDGISDVVTIAGGVARSVFALTADGTVWAWGTGGRTGDGKSVDRGTPEPVPGMTNVTHIASGADGGLVLKGDGSVWAWGNNSNGQLCDGTTTWALSPKQIPGLTGVVQLSGGNGDEISSYSGFAVKDDGTVWSWGSNRVGQLGDGTTADRHLPAQVPNLSGVKEIAGSIGATYALLEDGRVAAWGLTGIAGIGTTTSPGFFTPSRPVTKLRASQHNWHGFHALYLVTE